MLDIGIIKSIMYGKVVIISRDIVFNINNLIISVTNYSNPPIGCG